MLCLDETVFSWFSIPMLNSFICFSVIRYRVGAFDIIGEILAKQLASLGAKLIISARNEAELERVKKQLAGMLFYWKLYRVCFMLTC